MTPNQEELRKEWSEFVKQPHKFGSITTEVIANWWITKLDQASRLERAINEMQDICVYKHNGVWVAANGDPSNIEWENFAHHGYEGSTALEALENLSKKLNEN